MFLSCLESVTCYLLFVPAEAIVSIMLHKNMQKKIHIGGLTRVRPCVFPPWPPVILMNRCCGLSLLDTLESGKEFLLLIQTCKLVCVSQSTKFCYYLPRWNTLRVTALLLSCLQSWVRKLQSMSSFLQRLIHCASLSTFVIITNAHKSFCKGCFIEANMQIHC